MMATMAENGSQVVELLCGWLKYINRKKKPEKKKKNIVYPENPKNKKHRKLKKIQKAQLYIKSFFYFFISGTLIINGINIRKKLKRKITPAI